MLKFFLTILFCSIVFFTTDLSKVSYRSNTMSAAISCSYYYQKIDKLVIVVSYNNKTGDDITINKIIVNGKVANVQGIIMSSNVTYYTVSYDLVLFDLKFNNINKIVIYGQQNSDKFVIQSNYAIGNSSI